MKIITLLLAIGLIFVSLPAKPSENHNETNIYETTEVTKYDFRYKGTAAALANSHSFGWGTYKLQGSVGASTYAGENALSIAIGQRFKKILVTGSIVKSDKIDDIGGNINFGFRFDN